MKIGYYLNLSAKNSSLRIRYLNILKKLDSDKFEIYNAQNNSQYKIILFGKTFSDIDIEKAKQLKADGKHIYFDLCDNYFYNPQNLVEFVNHQENIKTIISLSTKIILSSEKLKDYIVSVMPEIDSKTHVIEDAYETELIQSTKLTHRLYSTTILIRYKLALQKNRINVFWFGNASCKNAEVGMRDLKKIQTKLESFNRSHKLHLTVMSNNIRIYKEHIKEFNLSTTYLAWNSEIFIDILKMQDAVLIPITLNPFTECKTNNRLIQALIHGVDVIADNIPSYNEFSDYCFLNNWNMGLKEVKIAKLDNKDKLARISSAQNIIENKYHINTMVKKWLDVFEAS